MDAWWNRYIGIPFQSRGRSFNGCDCWGLVVLVYEHELAHPLPSAGHLYLDATSSQQAAAAITQGKALVQAHEVQHPAPLDVVSFKPRESHIGVVVAPGVMIHCLPTIGVVEESYDEQYWRNRRVAAYRIARDSG